MLLLISLAACWYMTGLVWFVQAVAYPQFGRVAVADFAVYHRAHSMFTGFVVLPPMLVELLTAAALVWQSPHDRVMWASLALVVVIWVNTFGMAVPLHGRLSKGHDPQAIRRLVRINWIRTIAWTVRGLLLTGAAARLMG